jgi:hypothetical protein
VINRRAEQQVIAARRETFAPAFLCPTGDTVNVWALVTADEKPGLASGTFLDRINRIFWASPRFCFGLSPAAARYFFFGAALEADAAFFF